MTALTPHQSKMIFALRIYAGKGKALAEIAVPAVMNRVPDTLKRYCRLGRIAFKDYSPRNINSAGPLAADKPERGCAPRSTRAPAPLFDDPLDRILTTRHELPPFDEAKA